MKKKKLLTLAVAALLTVSTASTALAGVWKQDYIGWWWVNDDGSYPVNTWQWIDGNNDGVAECYYFNEVGYCLLNTTTPDGYQVDANGAWVVNGVTQTKQSGFTNTQKAEASSSLTTSVSDEYNSANVQKRIEEYAAWIQSNPEQFKDSYKMQYVLTQKSADIIDQFLTEYINDSMSDFEKEMAIIKWMCEHITYDIENYNAGTVPMHDYTAIYPLEYGLGVCNGYAITFNVLAKASGLTVKHVSGTSVNPEGNINHAWNQICLDGEWYNVDVTWADIDDTQSINLEYINVKDEDFSKGHAWDRSRAYACTSEKYGIDVIEGFAKEKGWNYITKRVKTISDYEKEFNERLASELSVFDDDSYRTFYYSSVNQTANEIIAYLSGLIDSRAETFAFKILYPDSISSSKIFQSNGSNKGITSQITDKVAAGLDSKYKGTVYKNSAEVILDQTRVYESQNGYWLTYTRHNDLTRLRYK